MSINLIDSKDGIPTIAIVGAGASGTLLASDLLRAGNARVVLIERGERVGRGLAYGTSFDGHLLNVPAASLSGLPDDPEHLLRFAREHYNPATQPTTFLPRLLYGEYLESLLAESEMLAAPGASLVHWNGDVVDIRRSSRATPWAPRFADGSRTHADRVVLALGNLQPRDPALASGKWPSDPAHHIRDPWVEGALAARAPGPTLLVGTGLTMVDVALQMQVERPGQRIVALSRGGLFPHTHRSTGAAPNPDVSIPGPTPSLPALLRFVRGSAAAAELGGGHRRDVVNALRPVTTELLAALPIEEQRRFLDRLARFWEIHRHRLAPQVATAIETLRANGRLTVVSGRIRAVKSERGAVSVTVQERASGETHALRVASVVNCTGASADVRRGGSPLLEALCAAGTVRPHPLGLGLDTGGLGAVRTARGRTSDSLFAIGPLRRGELWESTAIPEIRGQAVSLAQHLAQQLAPAALAV